uniref:Zinc finger protein 512 n=1 Tax=Sphenodon punctatus TaxID=8508 RepID=A0A8D0HEB1_SPHPU
RKLEQEDDEEYEEFTRKKQKVSGNCLPAVVLSENLSCPPCALAGSVEEQWHLQILAKGRVTCPTCRAVVRKTVAGLRKHMAKCRQEMFTCHHCGKQLRSLAGMKYHIMADHNSLPVVEEGGELDEQGERNRLRKVLKRMGKLKCTREGCTGSFTSIMGYLYHSKKCGKVASELEKMALKCHHCGKAYKSKAGLVYHLRSEHGPVTFLHENGRPESRKEMKVEPPPPHAGGRVQRKSAKVAIYYLHELASEELAKEWPKKKVLQDLVPDDRKLKYTRPGLPTFSQEVLCKWKSELKMHRRVHCPNQVTASPSFLMGQRRLVSARWLLSPAVVRSAAMAMASGKRCFTDATVVPIPNQHSQCLFCLGKGHVKRGFPASEAPSLRALKERKTKHQELLTPRVLTLSAPSHHPSSRAEIGSQA